MRHTFTIFVIFLLSICVQDAFGGLDDEVTKYNSSPLYPLEITNPITGNRIWVSGKSFDRKMSFSEANEACKALGNGWRLPTIEELNAMYYVFFKREGIYFFLEEYWSSSEAFGFSAWLFNFGNGKADYHLFNKFKTCHVRPVKDFKKSEYRIPKRISKKWEKDNDADSIF
jgi:hypothetical protein